MTQSVVQVREFDTARDLAAVEALDTSVASDMVYIATVAEHALSLAPVRATESRVKRFAIDMRSDASDIAYVALEQDAVRGVIALGYAAWNRRMVIREFFVDRAHRRSGIGRALMSRALVWGRDAGAVTAWLETSSRNYPGVEAYRRLGFDLCGFDLMLYAGTPVADEFALYMARRL